MKRQKQALEIAIKAKRRTEDSDHHKTEFLHRMEMSRLEMGASRSSEEIVDVDNEVRDSVARFHDEAA